MNKDNYLSNHLLTYIGNKRKLLPFIEKEIITIKHLLNKELVSIADLFSGSGSVSRLCKYHSHTLYVNDLENYSYMINQCYLINSKDKDIIKKSIDELNNLDYTKEGIICNYYSPKNTKDIQENERVFYTRENALIIDTIRDKINTYPKNIQPYLLGPLLIKAGRHTNTSGIFRGFHKKDTIGHFGGKNENDLGRICGEIKLEYPIYSTQSHNCDVNIYKQDTNQLIRELPFVDIIYLDPPYNIHPYGSNYHILNTILENTLENKSISKVVGIPNDWNRSNYCSTKHVYDSMKDLLKHCQCHYILLSYNDEGILSIEQLKDILNELNYTYEIKTQKYNTYRGSRNLQNRNKHVNEYLWLIKKI